MLAFQSRAKSTYNKSTFEVPIRCWKKDLNCIRFLIRSLYLFIFFSIYFYTHRKEFVRFILFLKNTCVGDFLCAFFGPLLTCLLINLWLPFLVIILTRKNSKINKIGSSMVQSRLANKYYGINIIRSYILLLAKVS